MVSGWIPFVIAELGREEDDDINGFTNNILYDINNILYDILKNIWKYLMAENQNIKK